MNGYYLSAIFIGKRLLFLHFYFFSFVVFSFIFDAQQLCVYPPMASSYSDNEMQINNTCNYKV